MRFQWRDGSRYTGTVAVRQSIKDRITIADSRQDQRVRAAINRLHRIERDSFCRRRKKNHMAATLLLGGLLFSSLCRRTPSKSEPALSHAHRRWPNEIINVSRLSIYSMGPEMLPCDTLHFKRNKLEQQSLTCTRYVWSSRHVGNQMYVFDWTPNDSGEC